MIEHRNIGWHYLGEFIEKSRGYDVRPCPHMAAPVHGPDAPA